MESSKHIYQDLLVHNMFCPQCPDFPLSTLLCSVHNVRVRTVPISGCSNIRKLFVLYQFPDVQTVRTVPISYVRTVGEHTEIGTVQTIRTYEIGTVRTQTLGQNIV